MGGAGSTVALTGAKSATTTADTSGNYSFSGLAIGSYTVTPTKSGFTFTPVNKMVALNSANVSGVNFTAQAVVPPTTGLAIDVKVSKDQGTAAGAVTSPALSTKQANELLLAFVATDAGLGKKSLVQSVSGAGLTWTLVARTNIQSGTAEIWRAWATSVASNVSVKATLSQAVVSSITVLSFTGADASPPIGATGSGNAKTGAPTANLVTTRNKSWVVGVGNDFDNAIARTPVAVQSLVHQDLSPTGDTYWVQMLNSTTPKAGTTVVVKDSVPVDDRFNLTIAEILPAK